jgi:hypothetical protein
MGQAPQPGRHMGVSAALWMRPARTPEGRTPVSNAQLFMEAADTAIRLGWALLGWLVFFATVASILTLAAIATGATVVRGAWRRTAGPSWRRSALRARILARRRVKAADGRTEPCPADNENYDYEEAA